MRVVIDQKADRFERFAPDVKLPAPGSIVHIREGGEATLVSARRIDDKTLRLELELPERYADLISAPSIGFSSPA